MTMSDDLPPTLKGIHHLKFAVSDIDRSLRFYERTLRAQRIPVADHIHDDGTLYGIILDVPGLGAALELRLDPYHAERHRHFDAVTFAIEDLRALMAWKEHLQAEHIPHSRVLAGLQAWLVVVEDPDGNRFRLYTLEQHGPEIEPDTDAWLET